MQVTTPDSCFNCGATENLTYDHIPPKSFFPPEQRENLIRVRCCFDCNNGFSKDDEAFRVFAASHINRSEAGDWVWKHGVMGSTFKRSPKLKQRAGEHLITASAGTTLPALTYPEERGNRFLIRTTKGLMRKYYPEVDYSNAEFEVTQVTPTQQIIDEVLSTFTSDQRGNGVFRFWRASAIDKQSEWVWVYVFYDGLMFMVEVST